MARVADVLIAQTREGGARFLEAYEQVPIDKRDFAPSPGSRSAIDMLAELAVITPRSTHLATHGSSLPSDRQAYLDAKAAAIAEGSDALVARFKSHLAELVLAIEKMSDADFDVVVETSFGKVPVWDALSFPGWNMGYHEGQIYYILSILGL